MLKNQAAAPYIVRILFLQVAYVWGARQQVQYSNFYFHGFGSRTKLSIVLDRTAYLSLQSFHDERRRTIVCTLQQSELGIRALPKNLSRLYMG
jgi:hypothetical protein